MKTLCMLTYKKTEIASFAIKKKNVLNTLHCSVVQKIQTTTSKGHWRKLLLKTHQNVNSGLNWATQS